MKRSGIILVLVFTLFGSLGAQGQCGPLTTLYAGNNGQDGIMFDVVALTSVEITNFDMDAYGNTHDYEIYYRPGTHVGFENSAAGWTLLGSAMSVPGNPRNSPTTIPITFSVVLCPGDVAGFYITSTSTSGSVSYTNGTGTGNVYSADANIQILEGTGKDYPFNFSYNPRVPNITCYYNCLMSCCTPPTATSNPTSCAGACDGDATATPGAGGVSPFTYQWDAAAGNQTTATATGLCAGTYSVDVTDGTGCTASTTVTVVDGPAGANATISPAGPFCESDAATNLSAVDPGGTWSGTGITDPVNGTFDPSVAGPGSHTITYDITGACGDTDTETITVNADADATITPIGPFCPGDPAVNMTGADPGGTWSGTGITDAVNGTFDPLVAGAGTHTITYSIGGACGDVQTYDVSVNSAFDATITPAGPFCESDAAVNLNAVDGGGTWSGTGITDPVNGTFDPSVAGPGSHTITYDITGACGDTDTETITVNTDADATITPAGSFCDGDPPVNMTGADPGGTWSGTGITDAVNGTFDPATAGAGTHTVTYSIGGSCPDSQTYDVVVSNGSDATITPAGPFCESNSSATLNAVDAGGTWSGTGITDPAAGTFDPTVAGPGTHTITYTIPGGCGDTDTENIQVIADDDATITPAGPFCDSDPATNLIAVDGGGTWSGTGITDPALGTFDPTIAGPGTHTITYDIPGACGDTDTEDITVSDQKDATITPAGPFCEGDPSTNLVAVDGGGTWSGTGITNPSAGTFAPATAGAGTHTITYDIPGACGDTQTETITVDPDQDATITAAGPFCVGEAAVTLSAVDGGGTWSGTGITDPANGVFDPAVAGIGTHTITYDIPNPCGDTKTTTITVTANDDATITPVGPFCEDASTVNLTAVDGGGTWSGTGITDPANGIFDPATAGPGTHTITYTIPGGCGDSQTTDVTVYGLPAVSFTTDTTEGCEPVSVEFVNTTPAHASCQWDLGGLSSPTECDTVNFTFPVGAHDISLTVTDTNGCTNSTTSSGLITVFPYPVAAFNAGPQPTTVLESEIMFENMSTGGSSYLWEFDTLGTSTTSDPAFEFPDADTFNVTLIVTSSNGCVSVVTNEVIIGEEFLLYIPNAFTPNGDGMNDFFGPVIDGVSDFDFEFYVFDRWGELVFKSNVPGEMWDGTYRGATKAKEDVYVWKIKARKSATEEQYDRIGHVTLLR